MIKLLLIEDDANLAYILKSSLEEIIGGYEVITANNGQEGIKQLDTYMPDVIVADIEMPVLNGLEMVKKIRQTDNDLPVIFATAMISSKFVTAGYEVGADLYIKKPFLPEELDAHIKSLINLKMIGRSKYRNEMKKIGRYDFDAKNLFLIHESNKQTLTVREAQILDLLLENKGEIVKRSDILLQFWGTEDFYTSRSLDVFITKMRRYLSGDENICIKNIRGLGLVLEVG